MKGTYDYRNCESLFGYAASAHVRSGSICQLCGCGDGKGVDFVLKFENEQGRDAIDMETEQINHPGFDVKSIDPQNPRNIRYIEVKSTAGLWDSANPAQIHKTQFETAQERGDSYWLYVVEQVESDNPKIYCIQNPANRVDTFMFDHGWQPLSKNDS